MPNEVRVSFLPEDKGLGNQVEKVNRLLYDIGQLAEQSGQKVDLKLAKQLQNLDESGLKRVAAGYREINRDAEQLRQTLDKMQNLRAPQVIAPRTSPVAGIDDPFNVRPDRSTSQVLSDRAVLARFNEAARRDIDGIAASTDKATAAQQRFHGASIVGTSILRSFGVEGSRALEVVGNQVLNLGVKLEDIFSNKLIRFTLAAAAGLAFKELADSVAEVNKQVAEFNTQSAQFGSRGGLETRASELQRLVQIQKALREQEAFGNFDQQKFIEQALGLKRPEQSFGTNFRDAFIEQVRSVTGGQLGIDVPGLLGFQTLAEQSQRLNNTLKDRHDIEERIREVMLQQQQIENDLGITAARHAAIRYQTAEQQGQLDQQLARIEYQTAVERQEREKKEAEERDRRLRQSAERAKQESRALQSFFTGSLQTALSISDYRAQASLIEAGLGGQGLRGQQVAQLAQRASIEQQIYEGRRAGTLSHAQQQALLDQYASTLTTSPQQRIEQESIDRQIEIANRFLSTATTAEQRQAALDAGLRATANISNLSDSELQARQRYLEQAALNQPQVLQERIQLERERLQTDREWINAANALVATWNKGLGIDFNFKADVDGDQMLGTTAGSQTLFGTSGGTSGTIGSGGKLDNDF